jgi:hypothetical protein
MKGHRRSLLQFLPVALCVSALVLALAPAAQVQQGSANVSTTMRGGLQTVTFDTIQGKVRVNLPDDMMAGDTISGTVSVQPNGQTQPELDKNEEDRSLSMELFFDAYKVNVPTDGGSHETFTIKVPAGTGNDKAGGQIKLALKDKDGSLIQTTTVPFAPPFGSILTISPPTGFKLPTIAQQGRPVEIPGPFDGSFENTKVTVGGEEVPILAESPRKAVFQSPMDTTGPAEIVVSEGKTETKGEYRNVKVKLSAPKTNLIKGESTTLKLEISGLQGIKEPLPLHLVKGGVVTMQGGDVQTMSIKPAEVQDNGTFSTTRTITGEETGVWNATATVVIFDVCLQDDNGNSLTFSSVTGDYIVCQGRGAPAGQNPIVLSTFDFGGDFRGGVMVSAGLLDSAGSAPGTISIGPGASLSRSGTVTLADFNFTAGHIHAQIDNYTHSGSATVQTTTPKQSFTITDRDTRNNTCTCK